MARSKKLTEKIRFHAYREFHGLGSLSRVDGILHEVMVCVPLTEEERNTIIGIRLTLTALIDEYKKNTKILKSSL
jgi:hypothetical protein